MGRRRSSSPKPPDSSQPQGGGGTRPLDLTIAKMTDVGQARPHNEDYVDYHIPPEPQQLARKGAIYLVADGMGGHQAGEVASQGAVKLVISQYYNDTGRDIGTSLVRAFRAANRQIHEWAQADPSKTGMGTTLVAAVILGRKVYVANVGDSRAYLVNHNGIRQITEDHSWVEEQVRAKLLTPEEARRHPQRNVVTRALGSKPAVEVDLFEGTMGEGDVLVLCSDGLTGLVEDREIAAAVTEKAPEEAARFLVAQANERGGGDNISVVIVSGQKQAAGGAAAGARKGRKPVPARRLMWTMGGVAGVLLAALLGLGLWLALPKFLTGGGTQTATTQTVADVSPTSALVDVPESTPAVSATPELPSTEVLTSTDPVEATIMPVELVSGTLPTATLIPTPVATTPAPTMPPATNSPKPPLASPRTPEPSPQPRYPAPVLTEPEKSAGLQGQRRFAWTYSGPPLKSDQAFDVRIWSKDDESTLARDQRRGAVAPTTACEAQIDLQGVPAIQEFGPGEYYWSVVVVQLSSCSPSCPPTVIGEWGEQREFSYTVSSGGGSKHETSTPEPRP